MSLLDLLGEEGAHREPAECLVFVNGTEIVDFYPYLKEVTVEMKRNEASTCTLVFETVRDEFGIWNIQDAMDGDSNVFYPWKQITISASFGGYVEEVMRGYIKDVRSECPQDMGSATVRVTGQDESILLDREQTCQSLSTQEGPLSDNAIITQLAGSFMEVDAEEGLSNATLGKATTDIELLKERARANGFEIYFREGTLYFHAPRLEGEHQSTIMVYAGRQTNCINFSTSFDGHKPDQVIVTRAASTGTESEEDIFESNLPLLGSRSADSQNSGLQPFIWSMPQPLGSENEEARSRAQAAANENAWKITGEGSLDGSVYGHVLLTHRTVRVDGAGESNNGIYYVDQVTHRFDSSGYKQDFRLLRNATGETEMDSSAHVLAGVI